VRGFAPHRYFLTGKGVAVATCIRTTQNPISELRLIKNL